MHLFDIQNDVPGTQRQFWIVFGVVSGVTYLLAIGMMSGVDRVEKVKVWISRLQQSMGSSQEKDAKSASWERGIRMWKKKGKRDEEKGDKPATT